MKTLTVLGTRPEAIKLAPVIDEFNSRTNFNSVVCSTGQHLEMLVGALDAFDVKLDYDLALMTNSQTLSGLTGRLVSGLDEVLVEEDPDAVIVQGDTTTAFVGALVGFYHEVPVGHVEAGLRSGDKRNPFPEEINRRLTDVLSNYYFAPTEASRSNLIEEGFPPERITVTGNTVIDALTSISRGIDMGRLNPALPEEADGLLGGGKRILLVTAHRRESLDGGISNICHAIRDLVNGYPDLNVIFPVHLNPKVREPVFDVLGSLERVKLIEPVDYVGFVKLMKAAKLILTDSGGIQEEAPSLGVPVLVARETTERPEAVVAGTARIVGTATGSIVREVSRLLNDSRAYEKMSRKVNPFGAGNAAKKIADELQCG